MPKDKTLSHEKIVNSAKEEFLQKGFLGASMRSIGEKAGITSAGLYRHYKNKEDMFDDLVKPALQELQRWYDWHVQTGYEQIKNNASQEDLFSSTMLDFVKEVLYPNSDGFNLLLKCSKGTKYENFINDIVLKQQRDMLLALEFMRIQGMPVKTLSNDEMHFIISAYTTALLEPFMHDMPIDEAESCLKTVEEFFMPGWEKIMGF